MGKEGYRYQFDRNHFDKKSYDRTSWETNIENEKKELIDCPLAVMSEKEKNREKDDDERGNGGQEHVLARKRIVGHESCREHANEETQKRNRKKETAQADISFATFL